MDETKERDKIINNLQKQIEEIEERIAIMLEGDPEPTGRRRRKMTREVIIDVVDRHVRFAEKWEEEFSTFTIDAVKAMLFYLKNPDKDDMED